MAIEFVKQITGSERDLAKGFLWVRRAPGREFGASVDEILFVESAESIHQLGVGLECRSKFGHSRSFFRISLAELAAFFGRRSLGHYIRRAEAAEPRLSRR